MARIPSIVAYYFRALDDEQMLLGYLAGFRNAPVPPEAQSVAYWHGWRNGRMAGGYAEQEAVRNMEQETMHHTIIVRIVTPIA